MPSKKSPLNCFRQTSKKYTSHKRKSPPFKANQCCGEIMTGNDGNRWTAVMNAKNICQWKPNRTANATKPKPAKKCPTGKVISVSGRCVKEKRHSATKPKPAKKCPRGKVRSPSGRCVKEKKQSATKPKPNKSKEVKSSEKEANVVAQLKYDLIASHEYEWAMENIKNISFFKENQHHFEIYTPVKDWKDGDVIQYNYFTPGIYGSFVSKTKIIPAFGEDYLQVPEEITKYTDDMMSMYKNLINNYIVGHTIYLSNKDAILKNFLKASLLKKVNKIKSKRPIFSLSIDKLADENTVYLQVSFPPESNQGWSKNYRVTRVVGKGNIDKQGIMGKGKIENEKELIGLIERSIGGKL